MILTKINADLKQAMKDKNTVKLSALRMLKSAITHKAKESMVSEEKLTDREISLVIRNMIKICKEEQSFLDSHSEKYNRLTETIDTLESCLRPSLSREQLEEIIDRVVTPGSDYESVMRVLSVQLKDRADLLVVAGMVRAKLDED